jgi:hypothetical protein
MTISDFFYSRRKQIGWTIGIGVGAYLLSQYLKNKITEFLEQAELDQLAREK